MRAAAFGVVGVEGWVGRARGGSMDDKSGNFGSGVAEGAIEVSGVREAAIEVSGVGDGAIEVSGFGDGAIELSGVAEGAIELSGVADTYQDELGEFMRNSESFLNGWLKVLLCAGFCC